MRAVQETSAGGGAPANVESAHPHRYALADFGLTGEQLDERFGGYLRSAHS
jgi:hypothetical protein